MDGTIADLYAVPNWLEKLRNYSPEPYAEARPKINMQELEKMLLKLQNKGFSICIVSWLSKEPTPSYDKLVTEAKRQWLKKQLPKVKFDIIDIIAYGQPKGEGREGILFDDELPNRRQWGEGAYSETEIFNVLKSLL